MARCLTCSQTFSQFIRPISLLSYTSKSKTDCVFKYHSKMNRKGLNAMPVLLKFLVPLAIFLSGSYAHAFTSLSPVAGNQARVNHLIRFEELMSNPTNEPSRESILRTNQRLKEEWANHILLSDQKRQVYSHISVGCCIRLKQEGANHISLFNQIRAHIPGPTILGGVGSRILKITHISRKTNWHLVITSWAYSGNRWLHEWS